MPLNKLNALQSYRLISLVEDVYENVPLYKKKFDEMGLNPGDIKGIEDITKLPFTLKNDMRESYPFDMFAKPMNEIVRVHASSGTTGKPTTVGYTNADIDNWAQMVARCLSAADADNDSIVQVAFGYGMFTGGLGLHNGVEKLGATVMPMSTGNTQKQLMLMKDYGATHIACTPSYAVYLTEAIEAEGIDPKDLKLRAGIFGGEPWSQGMREKIEKRLDIKAFDIYGLSEIMGPGVAGECIEQNGLHIWADHFFPEIIDPETLEPLPDGEEGELVITTLTKEGIPLIRYRTRDITKIIPGVCSCGRTHPKIAKIKARTDDMLIIKGVNVFPSQIETVLMGIDGIAPHYKIIVTREGSLDNMTVLVELSEDFVFDKISSLEELSRKITSKIESVVGIYAKVKIVEAKSLGRTEGKSARVDDQRNI